MWTKIGKEHGWIQEAENRGFTKAINVMVAALNKHRGPYLDIPLGVTSNKKTVKLGKCPNRWGGGQTQIPTSVSEKVGIKRGSEGI